MYEICKTVKVKAPTSNDNPLGFIVINESDLTAEHELFESQEKFSADGKKKPSDGMKVEKIREALTAKGIEIPEGAKKAELQALLDAS